MDGKFFEQAVLRLESKLYRTACALLWNDADAEDALQEAITRAWQKRRSLRETARFDSWMTRILINVCRDIQRKNREHPLPLEEEAVAAESPAQDMDLRDALRRLPEKYRLPLLLHHMDGYSQQEIGCMLHLPVSTVRGRLYQGRRQLKALLEGEEIP